MGLVSSPRLQSLGADSALVSVCAAFPGNSRARACPLLCSFLLFPHSLTAFESLRCRGRNTTEMIACFSRRRQRVKAVSTVNVSPLFTPTFASLALCLPASLELHECVNVPKNEEADVCFWCANKSSGCLKNNFIVLGGEPWSAHLFNSARVLVCSPSRRNPPITQC